MSRDENKKLLAFLKRRHPCYEENLPHWQFLAATYEGGPAWFKNNIHRYIKEGDNEFAQRLERAYRFNHTREVVDLTIKYLFKMDATRAEDAPEPLKKFWEKATLQGQSIRDYMRSVAVEASILGRTWVVVDSTKTVGTATKAQDREVGAQIYSYTITPENMLDLAYGEDGKLLWALTHEVVRDDKDPIEGTGALSSRYRLWERDGSTVFRIVTKGNSERVERDEKVPHELGVVPIFASDNVLNDDKYYSPALIVDVAYLDRASANYMSNLDAIIQDQTFSQLAMPADGVSSGDDTYDKLVEMGTKRIFLYNSGGAGNNAPFYLSPDVKQAQLILQVVNKIINEIYHSVGLAGERTKEDNAQGIDNSSGVAKAYDFERVNGLLAAKAASLEETENKLAELVLLYNSKPMPERLVEWPNDFDVRGLHDEFEIAARLALIEAPDGVRRRQMESVIDKLFPKLKKALRDKLLAELKDWPPELPDPADTAAPGAGGTKDIKAAGKQKLSAKLASK